MMNIREGGISIICLRWSLTGTRFFSSTAKTGVVLGIIMAPLAAPSRLPQMRRMSVAFGGGAQQGGGGRVKITPRVFGAFGVPSESEPVSVHLTTTNVPLPRNDWYEH